MKSAHLALALLGLSLWACSASEDVPTPDGDDDAGPRPGPDAASSVGSSSGGTSSGGVVGGDGGGLDASDAGGRVGPRCEVPLDLAPTTGASVFGDGTPASCQNETALATLIEAGGVITFSCGGPTTIALTKEITLPHGKDIVLDGGGEITIDGGGTTRLFKYYDGDFQKDNAKTVTFQRITLVNGKAAGTALSVQGTGKCSRGSKNDASGGAIFVRNAKLHLIDVTFRGNHTADHGPDVGGGAVFSVGSVDTTVVRSRFEDNHGSNGGAIGSLFGNLRVYDTVFKDNATTGFGGNGIDAACGKQDDGQHEVGSGGLGGAIYADGAEKHTLVLCGVEATGNHASSLGGFMFRVGYDSGQGLDVDLSTISDNTCDGTTDDGFEEGSAGAIYVQQQPVSIKRTTFARNRARGLGAALRFDYNAQVTMENVTVYGSVLSGGTKSRDNGNYGGLIGSAVFWSTNKPSSFKNVTLAENRIEGDAAGGFGAAIADPGNKTATALTIDSSLFVNNTQPNGEACQHTAKGTGNVQWPAGNACVEGATIADPGLAALTGNPELALPGAAAQVGTKCAETDEVGKPRATPCTLGAAER